VNNFVNKTRYLEWRKAKLGSRASHVDDVLVGIGGLSDLSESERIKILTTCNRSNMAIYQCRDKHVDRAAVCSFAANFGLLRLDHHLCANADGVSELSVAHQGTRTDYIPYTNHGLSWHTDGYYNDKARQINAVILHCVDNAEAGGENALFDPDLAWIRLYDEDPGFITAFEHPECMTIPANETGGGEIRPAVCGPVFSYDHGGEIHMRYSARKKNIVWRDDAVTTEARACLTEILNEKNGGVLRYRLGPGEGLITNNVLHNRTAFSDGGGHKRLLYRARFFDRIGTS
jgi:hypothetical protein